MIKNAPNPEAAVAFLQFVLSEDHGLKTLEQMGQPPMVPPIVPDDVMAQKMPAEIAGLVEVKD
jgi:molybdate/tungstate transport system substrate-binding protein